MLVYAIVLILVMLATNNPQVRTLISRIIPRRKGRPSMSKKFEKGKMVPVPSHAIIPEQDIDKSPILECDHLGIDFGGLRAVNDFNLTIGRTEIAGLIGPNGAGKTTIFNLLTKVYQPTQGTILLDGLDTSGKTTAQINRMGIAPDLPEHPPVQQPLRGGQCEDRSPQSGALLRHHRRSAPALVLEPGKGRS